MFEASLGFFAKVGEKNPELCLVMVFCLLLVMIFLFYQWKSHYVIQTLFTDYKETLKSDTEIKDKLNTSFGSFSKLIESCGKNSER